VRYSDEDTLFFLRLLFWFSLTRRSYCTCIVPIGFRPFPFRPALHSFTSLSSNYGWRIFWFYVFFRVGLFCRSLQPFQGPYYRSLSSFFPFSSAVHNRFFSLFVRTVCPGLFSAILLITPLPIFSFRFFPSTCLHLRGDRGDPALARSFFLGSSVLLHLHFAPDFNNAECSRRFYPSTTALSFHGSFPDVSSAHGVRSLLSPSDLHLRMIGLFPPPAFQLFSTLFFNAHFLVSSLLVTSFTVYVICFIPPSSWSSELYARSNFLLILAPPAPPIHSGLKPPDPDIAPPIPPSSKVGDSRGPGPSFFPPRGPTSVQILSPLFSHYSLLRC